MDREVVVGKNLFDRSRCLAVWSEIVQQVVHPWQDLFFKLAAEFVRAVKSMKDKNGVSYARKAMIRCGLGLDLDGEWQESQLLPELQMIISDHRAHFDETPVPEEAEEVEEIVQDSS